MSLKVKSLINALVIRKKTKNKGTTVSNTKDGITYGETNPANGVNGLKNLCAQKEIVILHLIYGIYVANLYPIPRTVWIKTGFRGSSSIFFRI